MTKKRGERKKREEKGEGYVWVSFMLHGRCWVMAPEKSNCTVEGCAVVLCTRCMYVAVAVLLFWSECLPCS